jgi:carbamoyltransferase
VTIVLGVSDSMTCGAALVVDGQVVAAVNEERLNRKKMCWGFPTLSIAEVLRIAGVSTSDVDRVAVAGVDLFWRPDAVTVEDYFRKDKGGTYQTLLGAGARLSTVAGGFGPARGAYRRLKSLLTRDRRSAFEAALCDRQGLTAPVKFYDHHLCHAASAYFTSGFDEATVITHDGAGDGKCSRVYAVRNGRFESLTALDSYDSIGNYYAYVTHLCGFKAHKHEGKITGLAAFGEPEYLEVLERFISFDGATVRNRGRCFDQSAIDKLDRVLPVDFSHANLSASIQVLLERAVTAYCNHWVERSGIPRVALAGGVFANVKLNQRIHEQPVVEQVFIHPGMGDEGLAVGAALFADARVRGFKPQPVLRDVYLGGELDQREIDEALSAMGLREFSRRCDMPSKVARLLADGKVIARCAGRMEYGPRALGNRTIMYRTTEPAVNKWLNERLARTEFMPFAPVTLWQFRDACYEGVEGAEDAARFMTMTFNCRARMRDESPAVCHVDGTARPQLVRPDDNPEYYAILRDYHALTGIPSLVNTSFNIHDEPIVYSPRDAVRAFLQSQLDGLILGDVLIESPRLVSQRAAGADRAPDAAVTEELAMTGKGRVA